MQKQLDIFLESDVVDICKLNPTLVLPHPHECQMYYNCSMIEDERMTSGTCRRVMYLTECIYPDLFSEETLQCENFTNVKCGQRQEIKYLCK